MKIAILTDVHSNIYGLEAVVNDINNQVDDIYSLGDAIAIGPYPRETMDMMVKNNIKMLMGNHEQYYLMGEDDLKRNNLSHGEILHQKWVAEALGQDYKNIIRTLPLSIDLDIKGIKIHLSHYAMDNGGYKDIIKEPNGEVLYKYFDGKSDHIYIFGHHHPIHDYTHKGARFINPGSLGCSHDNLAR